MEQNQKTVEELIEHIEFLENEITDITEFLDGKQIVDIADDS